MLPTSSRVAMLSDHELIITLIPTSSAIFVCLFTIVCLIANQFNALFVWLHRPPWPSEIFGFAWGVGAKNCFASPRNIPEQIHFKNCETHMRLNALRANAYYKNCCVKIPAPHKLKVSD
jgi:hypothetical protein